jgi:hypothetical protein
MDELDEARAALQPPGRRLDDPTLRGVDGPGLYAVHGPGHVWEELGLRTPPDKRPLYVGKAEVSLISRDVRTHFETGRTGSSTLRRTLAALLQEPLGIRAQPRNPNNPERFANYGIEPEGDKKLTEWMRTHLTLALWFRSVVDGELVRIEQALLKQWEPPLNGKDVKTPWSVYIKTARKRMADEARTWTRSQS